MNNNQSPRLAEPLYISHSFWRTKLEALCHPVALRMADDLDVNGPLGIGDPQSSFWRGFKHDFGAKDSSIDFLLRIKHQHPHKIVLVQIGEFYETWGLDSVFLVEHCGLNRMGKRGPRAGLPLTNIQAVLDGLTQAGFSVVVCEQTDDPYRKSRKTRFISEIISPSSPTYTYGLAMRTYGNISFPETTPEFALNQNSKGLQVTEINPDLKTSLTYEGLTEEAALARLVKYGEPISRVFYQESVPTRFLKRARQKTHNLIKISGYSSQHFTHRVEELIQIDLGLKAETAFVKIQPTHSPHQPRPLYRATAEQIGLLDKVGLPRLVHCMLPPESPALCRHMVKNLLLTPPPREVAGRLRKALVNLTQDQTPLPRFIVSGPVKYVKTLQKGEAHPEILQDLLTLAHIFLTCAEKKKPSFMQDVLTVTSHICSLPADLTQLSKTAHTIVQILEPLLPQDDDPPYMPQDDALSAFLFEHIEDKFRGRVLKTAHPRLTEVYAQVEKAAKNYERALTTDLLPLVQQKQQAKTKNCAISYDLHNQSLWLRGPLTSEDVHLHQLRHPQDRYGKEVKNRWTTAPVENALKEYKDAALAAATHVEYVLKETAKKLSPHCMSIVQLASFSNLLKTLYLHIKECQPKQWTLNLNQDPETTARLALKNFFPYWMKPHQAVLNSLAIDGTCLLTGHNMSGKSTVLRSLAATTLLASSGFMFPAHQVALREDIDGWFVRTGAEDDPESGLSSFAVEMLEMKAILRDASTKSLLLIDELGKGTESQAGHAIAGSVLETLAHRGIKSVFSTHWHELFFNSQVDLKTIQKIQMQSTETGPTYRLIEGINLSSSAFQTALDIGIDPQVIARAQQIAQSTPSPINSFVSPPSLSAHLPTAKTSLDEAQNELAQIAKVALNHIHHISGDELASPAHLGSSMVYILKTSNNFFYVGETDNFLSRMEAHKARLGDQNCEFIYTSISQGKSRARQIEQQLIARLKSQGFPLLSTADERHSHFGGLSSSPQTEISF